MLCRRQALPAGLRGSKSLPSEATQEFHDKNLPRRSCRAWGREGAEVGLKAAERAGPQGAHPQRPPHLLLLRPEGCVSVPAVLPHGAGQLLPPVREQKHSQVLCTTG